MIPQTKTIVKSNNKKTRRLQRVKIKVDKAIKEIYPKALSEAGIKFSFASDDIIHAWGKPKDIAQILDNELYRSVQQ